MTETLMSENVIIYCAKLNMMTSFQQVNRYIIVLNLSKIQ